jgi:hypothetical protein
MKNTYNNDSSRSGYLALPLETTGMHSTYGRSPSSLQWVSVDQASTVEHRNIFIQLQAVQVSRITLLEDFNLAQFSSEIYTFKKYCTELKQEGS